MTEDNRRAPNTTVGPWKTRQCLLMTQQVDLLVPPKTSTLAHRDNKVKLPVESNHTMSRARPWNYHTRELQGRETEPLPTLCLACGGVAMGGAGAVAQSDAWQPLLELAL